MSLCPIELNIGQQLDHTIGCKRRCIRILLTIATRADMTNTFVQDDLNQAYKQDKWLIEDPSSWKKMPHNEEDGAAWQ